MKDAFYFTLKALFGLKIFEYLSWFFSHTEKRPITTHILLIVARNKDN